MLRALIFDVDETLVYYEGYDHKEWFYGWVLPALEERGIHLDYEIYRKTVRGELPRSYVQRFGINPVELWKIIDGVNLMFRKHLAEEGRVKAFPDVGVLKELRKLGLKMAAVSNASQECTEFVLRLFDLERYFDVVYGKDYSYLDGVKPSPYLVKKALKSLNVKPSEALMVGDSHHDVLAGKRAGVGVVNVVRFEKIEGADYYVNDLWELLDLVKKMI